MERIYRVQYVKAQVPRVRAICSVLAFACLAFGLYYLFVFSFISSIGPFLAVLALLAAIAWTKTDRQDYKGCQVAGVVSLLFVHLGVATAESTAKRALLSQLAVSCVQLGYIGDDVVLMTLMAGPLLFRLNFPTTVTLSSISCLSYLLISLATGMAHSFFPPAAMRVLCASATAPLLAHTFERHQRVSAYTQRALRREVSFWKERSGSGKGGGDEGSGEAISLDGPLAYAIHTIRNTLQVYSRVMSKGHSKGLVKCIDKLANLGRDLLRVDIDAVVRRKDLDEDVKSWLLTNVATRDDGVVRRQAPVPVARAAMVANNVPGSVRHMSVELASCEQSLHQLCTSGNWSWDTFDFFRVTDNALAVMFCYMLREQGLVAMFAIPTLALQRCSRQIHELHSDQPYHNAMHGANVLYDMYWLLLHGDLYRNMTDIHLLAALFAAAIHDIAHPGVTNAFHSNTRSELSLCYSDDAVNERHHLHTGFRIVSQANQDIFANLDRENYKTLRACVIEMVLATDLASHFSILGDLKTQLLAAQSQLPAHLKSRAAYSAATATPASPMPGDAETKTPGGGGGGGGNFSDEARIALLDLAFKQKPIMCLRLAIKVADISHVSKERRLHVKWSEMITEEMCRQGDTEHRLGFAVQAFQDRKKLAIGDSLARSQVGFFDFVCKPLYQLALPLLNRAEQVRSSLDGNYNYWKGKVNAVSPAAVPPPATASPTLPSRDTNDSLRNLETPPP